MNLTLKRTEEQVELVKAMASKNRNVAHEAQAAAAEFIGPVLSEIMNNAPTLSNMFQSFSFNDDDNPSIPLDLYHDVDGTDYLSVYSQSVAGGLPSNSVIPTHSELKFATYRLETAVDFDRRYAARSRLDVVSKTFTRVAQELLIKQENTSANLVMGVLAKATTGSSNLKHVIKSSTENQFLLADVNSLLTHAKRLNTAWNGGSPVSGTRGVTDLLVSPEIMGEVRAMAYNPVNTRGISTTLPVTIPAGTDAAGGSTTVTNTGAGVIPASEAMRDDLYRNAGASELYGITLLEINELGISQRFNDVFDTIDNNAGSFGQAAAQFATADDEIIVGIDRTRDSLMRAVAVDGDSGAELNLVADDQYSVRQNKIGYYGSMEEGRMVLDSRAVTGIVV